MLESKKCPIPAILLKMLIWTCCGMTWKHFLDLKQTLRVLLKTYFHQPLRFESLSLRTPQTVPPTPSTALQNKIESKVEKSLGNQFNIQLQQQMGVFQVSMLEAMKSLREQMQSMKKASEAEVDKTSASTSKAGPSKQSDPIIHPNPRASNHSDAQPMKTDFCGPSLPQQFTQSVQSDHGSGHSDLQSEHSDPQSEHLEQPQRVCSSRAKKHSDKKKHQVSGKILFTVFIFRGGSALCPC